MKKKLLLLSLALGIWIPVFAAPAPTSAVNIFQQQCKANPSTDVCSDASSNTSPNPVIDVLRNVINIVSYIIGVAAVIMIIVSGMRMMLGGDDPNTVSSARNGILYAVIGLAVAIVAQTLVIFVLNKIK